MYFNELYVAYPSLNLSLKITPDLFYLHIEYYRKVASKTV